MRIKDLLTETFLSLTANKARSFLTILGIVVGITSVIVMVAFGQGTKASITVEHHVDGRQPAHRHRRAVRRAARSAEAGSAPTPSRSRWRMSRRSARRSPTSSRCAQTTSGSYQVSAEASNTNVTVTGTTPDYPSDPQRHPAVRELVH